MSDPLCRWCHKTLAEHGGEDAPRARMPCLGRKSGFSAVPEVLATTGAPKIFGKPMVVTGSDPRYFELALGPFRLGVMAASQANKDKGKSYWFVESKVRYGDLLSGYSKDDGSAARDIERALVEIETTLREARGA